MDVDNWHIGWTIVSQEEAINNVLKNMKTAIAPPLKLTKLVLIYSILLYGKFKFSLSYFTQLVWFKIPNRI